MKFEWRKKIRQKMTLKEEFLRHYRAATLLYMMMGLCDAAVSFTVFKYSRMFFFEHEGGILARITINSYIDMNQNIFYLSVIGHIFIYIGTILLGIYVIHSFKKESDDAIKNISSVTKWSFIFLLLTLYAGGFLHYLGAISWLVN